jgi:transglutaminase-like putative cysteine protease
MERGTDVVLERPATIEDLEALVRNAVLRDAPFLNRRGGKPKPLEVTVNGIPVRAEMELPPPSLSFGRRGLRGVVGLGPEPRVEVFAHGLRVRDAASLDELLLAGRVGRSTMPATAKGLAPRVVIDSVNLSVLMARGDAREDRALRRLVEIGHRELGRLIRAELDRHARLRFPARLWERLRETWTASWVLKIAAAATALGVAVVIGSRILPPAVMSGSNLEPAETIASAAAGDNVVAEPYRDLGDRYRGPTVSSVSRTRSAVDLQYRPPRERPVFAALVIPGIQSNGEPVGGPASKAMPYRGAACGGGCLEVALGIETAAGLFRIPVATGHLIDPRSALLDGKPVALLSTAAGEACVHIEEPTRGRLVYRSSPGESDTAPVIGPWPALPDELHNFSRTLEGLPYGDRAAAAVDFVRQRVSYDTSPGTAARYSRARLGQLNFLERTLDIGAGDCDVQNAVVATLLNSVGVPARLAVGWAGAEGNAMPGLHAWVEYLGAGGRWMVADASSGAISTDKDPGPLVQEPAPSSDAKVVAIPVAGAIVILVIVAAALPVIGRWLWKRSFRPGGDADLTELLRGAAIHPEAFARVDPLFRRPVVPTVRGRPVSLGRIQRAAERGVLACGSKGSRLATRAASAGGLVLDVGEPRAELVAGAFGAIDLDHWQRVLDHARSEPVAERVEEALAGAGELCRVRVSSRVGEESAVLDGPAAGIRGNGCWIVLDETAGLWGVVSRLAKQRPAAAALFLADTLVDRLGVAEDNRGRCLKVLAREAVFERLREVSE